MSILDLFGDPDAVFEQPPESSWEVKHGDCLDVMKTMGDASVDAVVTDPPYGLSFMGQNWDHGVPGVEFWKEALRVAKPGAHLAAFGGTRTHHRLMVAIEDAGWEIRDCTMWMYGSGFPKSLDVSKAIDKVNGETGRLRKFTTWMRTTGLKARQIDDVLKCEGLISPNSNFAIHYFNDGQPAIPTAVMWIHVRPLCGDVPAWVDELVERIEAEREVVGQRRQRANNNATSNAPMNASAGDVELLTAPATDAARKWVGWSTALKPAWEPIILARKPLEGTVARNVLKYGTGALNIDGCRVEVFKQDAEAMDRCNMPGSGQFGGDNSLIYEGDDELTPTGEKMATSKGRWPANLIWDGSEEVKSLFPHTVSGSINPERHHHKGGKGNALQGSKDGSLNNYLPHQVHVGDAGSASRYFKATPHGEEDLDILPYYCAKANKRDRDEGLGAMPTVTADPYGQHRGRRMEDNNTRIDGKPASVGKNFHPCVKPVALMRYLCRLMTPPGGLVLDPFCGSGSTGKAALLEGFNFVGIEREEEYVKIAQARCENAASQSKEQVVTKS